MSTPISQRLAELERVLAGHKDDLVEAERIGRLARRSERLSRAATRASEAATDLKGLADEGAPVVLSVDAALLESRLEEAKARTTEDSLSGGDEGQPPIVELLEEAAKSSKDAVQVSWGRYKRRTGVPTIDEELLELASREDPGIASRVEKLSMEIMLLREKVTPAPEDLTRYRDLVTKLRKLSIEVSELAPSESVVSFLRAASSTGATIAQLDHPEVRAWLGEDEKRSRRFIVRSRQS